MSAPNRHLDGRKFSDLRAGDFCYSIDGDGKRVWAIVEQVVAIWKGGACPVRGGLFKTIPCYSNGQPMLYLGMWFRRTSGIEYANNSFDPPTDRPRTRLYLGLPKGVFAVSRGRVAG